MPLDWQSKHDIILPGPPWALYIRGVIAYEGIGGTIVGMLSGGGFEYMLILVASAVVRRPVCV